MGVILDDWMDMQLSASPDCLQLSVSMPTLPQENGKVGMVVEVGFLGDTNFKAI